MPDAAETVQQEHDPNGRSTSMKRTRKKSGLSRLIGWVSAGLTVAAVLQELRLPADERTWHGQILYVPYDFRLPTLERLRERLWAPDEGLVVPQVFGVGWSINIGRVVALVTNRRS
jgi:hypothetical protein